MRSRKCCTGRDWLTISLLALSIPPAALAQQADKRPVESADSDLLKELETDLLKDLPAAKKRAAPPGASDKGETRRRSPQDRQLLDDLKGGEDLGSEPENPLLKIGQQMRSVQQRIAERDTSGETQAKQEEIVTELEKLIQQAQQQRSSQNRTASGRGTGKAGVGDGQATPGAPQDSTDRVGKPQADAPQATDVRNLLQRIWGHLPEKTRDEMQNALSDQFLPKYEKLIEEYYKRLAEERSRSDFGSRGAE